MREILNAIFSIGYAADVPGCEWSGGTTATIVNIGDLVLQNHFYSYAGYAAIPEPIYTMTRDCPGFGWGYYQGRPYNPAWFHTGAPDPQLPDNVGVTSLAGQYISPPSPDGKSVHWKWNLTAG